MRRVFLSVVALLALGALVSACGSSKKEETTASAAGLPAEQVSKADGAKAHSAADVTECSTMNAKGNVGTVSFGGFEDISVTGLSCEEVRRLILDVATTLSGTKVNSTYKDYKCAVIESLKGGLLTIRCVSPSSTFRFTYVPVKAPEIATECGTFGRFYDVTALGQGCQQVAQFLDNTPTTELTDIPEGKSVKVGQQICKTLYVEKNHKTIHCDQVTKSMRFSIAEKASTQHPPHYSEKPSDAGKPHAAKNPNVITSCNAVGPFNAITAKGVPCAAVSTVLQSNTVQLKGLKSGGGSIPAGGFTCQRIDSGGQTATVQCKNTGGASFRASFIAPTDPAPTVPPATTSSAAPTNSAPSDSGADSGAGAGGSGGGAGAGGSPGAGDSSQGTGY